MQPQCPVFIPTTSSKGFDALNLRGKFFAIVACLIPLLSGYGLSQTLSTFAGMNTVQNHINSTATPDVTSAVGTLEYCEHVNSGYQCWYKSTNQPVKFMGNTNVKSRSEEHTSELQSLRHLVCRL